MITHRAVGPNRCTPPMSRTDESHHVGMGRPVQAPDAPLAPRSQKISRRPGQRLFCGDYCLGHANRQFLSIFLPHLSVVLWLWVIVGCLLHAPAATRVDCFTADSLKHDRNTDTQAAACKRICMMFKEGRHDVRSQCLVTYRSHCKNTCPWIPNSLQVPSARRSQTEFCRPPCAPPRQG